jgi:predicted dehydrogenase
MKKLLIIILLCCAISSVWAAGSNQPPVRLVIIGLDHDAVGDFISRTRGRQEIQLAGIVESNQMLVTSYARSLNLSTNFFYSSLESLLAKTNVQAAAVFTRTFDHASVVEACAAHKIDVMLEKPLAVNLDGALAIASAAKRGGIQIMVDYETSWYSSFATAYTIVHNQHAIGDLRKMIVTAGDVGPKDAGCSDAFLEWLTDPVLNGGGALTDFGCYGAGLITWFEDGRRPDSVMAQAQNLNPGTYTRVEDEATIIVTYPRAQGIIQASWNLPFSERSLQVYGNTGYILAPRMDLLRLRLAGTEESELELRTQPEPGVFTDDLSYFAAIVRREVKPTGPSSLQSNLITTEILDAAQQSIKLRKQIDLPHSPAW